MKISVIMATARDDYSLVDLPNVHLFQPTVESLRKQTMMDFELVVVDGLYSEREGFFRNAGFPVRHLPPKWSPYAANGTWSLCNSVNTALLNAQGELVVKIDDACELDQNYLKRIWNWHTAGLCTLSLMLYYRGGRVARYDELTRRYFDASSDQAMGVGYDEHKRQRTNVFDQLYREGQAIEDSRFKLMGSEMVLAPWSWVYGYLSAPLSLFLDINGYDEAFDGKKSLEDVDFGLRAFNAGFRDRFVLEKGLWAVENFHDSGNPKLLWNKGKPAACNYAILKLHERQDTKRANVRKFTHTELARIRKESAQKPCSHYGGEEFDLGDGFDSWAKNVPVFDLAEMRRGLGARDEAAPVSDPPEKKGSPS